MYNLLDWPAGVVPVTKVTNEDISNVKDYPKNPPYSEMIREVIVLLYLKLHKKKCVYWEALHICNII